ncbi:MAG: type I DNA topoisomerase [Clostridiaceae bacterium]|jgi:DNA topoisomerase-1|nr:type I DNA topoisomerase [Clostridiaceae bacterium]
MKKLIIVESPSKAKTIQKYLGGDYAVLASSGHVCDLPQRTLGIDVENRFCPEYIVTPEKQDIIKKLTSAVSKYETTYLATDPDREGEAISWHLKNVLGLPDGAIRIEFHEISKKAVNTALESPRELNMNLVNSQQARRVLDRLVGYRISPILSKKIKQGLSAGRVQSPALEMIVEREKEIRNFVPEEYWNLAVILVKENQSPENKKNLVTAQFVEINGKKYKVEREAQALRIKEFCVSPAAVYTVENVKRSKSASHPAPPFTTSTMTQDASQKLNMTAPESMRVAQQLYEGVEVEGEGLTALVTYIRTDSVRVSPDFQYKTLDFIKENFGEDYAPEKPNFYKTKSDAQDAHEAIRPISLALTPDSLKGKIKRDQHRLYKLVYERYLASQMTNAIYNTLNVKIKAENPEIPEHILGFSVKGRSIAFKGFTAVYDENKPEVEKDSPDNEETAIASIPNLTEGEKLDFVDFKGEQKFTKPPARYNDATLIKALEENGIGRPSTYATIISVLSRREYTKKDGKSIAPTELGEIVSDYMVKFFTDIMDLAFTATLESELDRIAEEGIEWQDIIEKFYHTLENELHNAQKSTASVRRPQGEESDVECDKCGAKMFIKEGRYGKFLACPNYPRCKNIKPLNESVGKCPLCGSDVVKKRSKAGKNFYGCSNYPTCNFISWDIPAPTLCPECNSPMRVSTSKGEAVYLCTSKGCKGRVVPEKDVQADEERGAEHKVADGENG